MPKSFRQEKNRAHAHVPEARQKPLRMPFSQYMPSVAVEGETLLFATKMANAGRMTNLSVDIGHMDGDGSLRLRVYYPSAEGGGEEKENLAHPGHNELGSFDLLENARVEISFLPSENCTRLEKVYMAATITY